MTDYLLVYDVGVMEGEQRLRRVARICEGYGTRVQKSVFELVLNDDHMIRLKADLEKVMDPGADSVRIYTTTGRPASTHGRQRRWTTSRGPLHW